MLQWLTAIASLIGVWLNWICAFTRTTRTYVDLQHGIDPHDVLKTAYFLLAIYGIVHWSANYLSKRKRNSISLMKGKDP